MMKFVRNPRFLPSLTCALLLCNAALFAEIPNDQPQEKPQEEHVSVGSRPMDPEKIKMIEAQALKRAYESDETQTPPTSEFQLALKNAKYQIEGEPEFRLASAKVSNSLFSLVNFPISCHWLSYLAPLLHYQ